MSYQQFISNKTHSRIDGGIGSFTEINGMKDFQSEISDRAVKSGRIGVFADTGLGKTLIALCIAENYLRHTNKPVLILTPLAVAFQFEQEAEKFGVNEVKQSKDGTFSNNSRIVVINYERLDKVDMSLFDTVILDESSILKNFDGAIRTKIITALRKVKYRFLMSATPSPNDYIELGNSSEALGSLGYTDMLTRFFTNKQRSIDTVVGDEWYLKPHATDAFWQWVSSWAIAVRKPSDLGFSDEGYDLPPLTIDNHKIINKNPIVIDGQQMLFNMTAITNSELRAETKATVSDRCQKAVELSESHPYTVYWCNLNAEADAICKMDKSAVEIRGDMPLEKKEDIIISFSKGDISRLVTKPSITCYGLNWQHCSHTTYFPTYSFESYYQAIRRFYRFGQTKPVTVDRIYSSGQDRVLKIVDKKHDKAIKTFEKISASLARVSQPDINIQQNDVVLPSFI